MSAASIPPYYEIIRELGSGQYTTVYLVRDTQLDRIAALKVLRLEGVACADLVRRRFLTEAHNLAALYHPGIVRLYDIVEFQGTMYWCCEFVDGGSLSQQLASGPFSPHEAARLIVRVAEAVHHVHERGLLLGDLDPTNILLATASDGSAERFLPKIADVSLARPMEECRVERERPLAGRAVSLPQERLAEQFNDLGPWSDVYSLGVLLYECLTGQPPFRGRTT